MKDGEHYHNGINPEGKHDHRKLAGLILLSVIFGFVVYSLAQSAQTTADINNIFAPVPNNTNLAPDFSGIDPTVPFGTGERVQNVTYNATNYSLDLHVFAHAMSVSDTASVKVYIDGVLVSPRSGRPLGAAETAYRGVDITIPKNSSYLVNITNYHHYEWREYPILAGKNGTLSLNQTFITTGSSFNDTYDQTTKEYNANYTSQTFPNSSVYGLVDVLNSSKVNKSGDTMTGNLDMGAHLINLTFPGAINSSAPTASSFIIYNGATIIGNRAGAIRLINENTANTATVILGSGSSGSSGDALTIQSLASTDPLKVVVTRNLSIGTGGKGFILKSGSVSSPVCAFVNLSDAGGLMTTSITCP